MSARIFRVGVLMQGKPPSPVELLRWIRSVSNHPGHGVIDTDATPTTRTSGHPGGWLPQEPWGARGAGMGHGNFLQDYWQDRPATRRTRGPSGPAWDDRNRYPYTNGHLLVALGRPAPKLGDYDPDQRAAFWNLIELASRLVHRTLNPQGLNIGINEGSAAGAGVPEHLHGHVVPRWGGDTNFMTVVGAVRVAPDALESVAAEYRAAIDRGLLEE